MKIGDKLIFLTLLTFAITPNLGFFTAFAFGLLSLVFFWILSIYVYKNRKDILDKITYELLYYFTLFVLLIAIFYYGGLYQVSDTVILGKLLLIIFLALFLFKRLSFNVIITFYLIVAFITLIGSPSPRCDCFTTVKEAGLKLLSGENPYNTVYSPVYPGKTINYFYHLPFSFLFTLPFTIIFGDPRVSIIFSSLAIVYLFKKIFNTDTYKLAVITFLFSPRSFYILEHMYQEPNMFLFFVLYVYFLTKKKYLEAILSLILFFSFKIHVIVLAPFLFTYLKDSLKKAMQSKPAFFILFLPFLFPIYFLLLDPKNFIRNVLFFLFPSTIVAPIEKSLSFTTFIKFLWPDYYLYYSLILLLPTLGIFLKEKEFFTRVFLVLFAIHYFLGYSFFNHYYLIYLLANFSLFLDTKKFKRAK